MRTQFLHEWTEKDLRRGYTDKDVFEAFVVCTCGVLAVSILAIALIVGGLK